MTTLESIRKRKALLGKSKEEYDAFREKWENVYYELGKKLQPDAKGFDDYGYWRLIEAVGHKNPKEFIKKEYNIELSEEDMAKFDEMVNAIRTEYPARYFETKFERPLQLSDFTAAVVPNDIPLDVESRLKDAGVEVIEYEKDNNTSRAEAMQKASAMENVRFSLQTINELSDALTEYNTTSDITSFVDAVREANDKFGKHPYLTNLILDYEEDGDADAFAEKVKGVIGDANGDYAPYTAGGVSYSMASPEETAYSNVRYSIQETDPVILDALNNGETIKVYRAMQVIDGELYPPMSAKVDGKLRNPIKIGVWERAEERPNLADEKGNFKLDKGNKTSLKARYNPYIHTSLTPLNDQFSSAQDRPNLVTVEVEVPVSELTSGYKAEKAKDAVGKLEWKAGVVQGQLTGTRTVILSRWDRPIRIVPDSEVAQRIVEMFGDTKVVMPSNVVTPSLRTELEKLGVPFKETTPPSSTRGKPILF